MQLQVSRKFKRGKEEKGKKPLNFWKSQANQENVQF